MMIAALALASTPMMVAAAAAPQQYTCEIKIGDELGHSPSGEWTTISITPNDYYKYILSSKSGSWFLSNTVAAGVLSSCSYAGSGDQEAIACDGKGMRFSMNVATKRFEIYLQSQYTVWPLLVRDGKAPPMVGAGGVEAGECSAWVNVSVPPLRK